MNQTLRLAVGLCAVVLMSPPGLGAEPASGWRGNATGLWPDSKAPTQWHRLAHGAMEGLRAQATLPADADAGKATLVSKGLVSQWLVLGPLAVADSVKNFDDDLLAGEATVSPTFGDSAASSTWQQVAAPWDDPMIFGSAELPFVDLAKAKGFEQNRIAYAHAYLYSPRGGPVRAVVEHGFGLKAWVNGREVYRAPTRVSALGNYPAISRWELEYIEPVAGRFEFDLKPGWNRLLLKISSSNKDDFKEQGFCLRLMDPPDVAYESKNIRWLTELPGRSTSTPIIFGERVFLAAEPDLLVCLDKRSGKLLWQAASNYYEALTPQERQANPAFATRVDPLEAKLKSETDRSRRRELRGQIQQVLVELDAPRFQLRNDGHFASHFGIVGLTMPTPVSDGKHVYVWCGLGVAACYDLDGNRKWITRVLTDELTYGSSPALASGVLAVFLGKLHGLDAATGELRWTQPKIHKNVAAIQGASFAGQQVFVTQLGEVVSPADGKLLFRPRDQVAGDGASWGPPLVLGNMMHLCKYGIHHLSMYDFSKVTAEQWKPETLASFDLELPRELSLRSDGSWLDRSTAGSPLVHNGLVYLVDIYGWLYVADLETHKTVYYKDLGIQGLMHYNAVPVAASPTLIGENLIVVDNQGTALVLATGRQFKEIAHACGR